MAIETAYPFHMEQKVEKLIMNQDLHYIHMAFQPGEGLPEHIANSNVYMTVVHGVLSLQLNDQAITPYFGGTLLSIPKGTKMNVRNQSGKLLELIVVKVPSPDARH